MAETNDTQDSSAALAEVLRKRFDGAWTTPDGWPGEADTALIDSVFSTRARYETVVKPIIERWRLHRSPDGSLEVLATISTEELAAIVKNNQYVPGRSANRLTKVDAVRDVAKRLVARGWSHPAQIEDAARTFPEEFRREFTATPGVGPAQFSYYLMLLGLPGVKPDTLVTAWVERALGLENLSQKSIEAIVVGAARILCENPTTVDHTIWSDESAARGQARRRR